MERRTRATLTDGTRIGAVFSPRTTRSLEPGYLLRVVARLLMVSAAFLAVGLARSASGDEPPASSQSSDSGPAMTADLDFQATGVDIKGQLGNLGSFEKRALATALKRRGLELDLEPYGKLVRKIRVVNLDVFGPDDGVLRIFNLLHVTTREYIIEREVLLRPGQPWDDETVQETRRRLTDITVTTLAVLAPVKSPEPGTVDLLVVTRDIFSLRLNSNYEIAGAGAVPIPGFGGKIISLSIAPSENNLLGLRKNLSIPFVMDLGQWAIGPRYIDPRVYGTRVRFASQAQLIFAREDSDFEGTASSTSLSYPLWSYRREWAWSVAASHIDAPTRQFSGVDLLGYDNPDTPEVEAVPRIFDNFGFNLSEAVTRSLGYRYKSNFSLGHQLRIIRPKVQEGFPGDATLQAAFERDVLPRSERSSALTFGYSFFTPRFITYRNIDTYSLPEDVRLGPEVSLSASWARKEIGSERNFINLGAGASWTFDLFGDGFARASFSLGTRIEESDARDNSFVASARIVPPRLFGLWRIVSRIAYTSIVDNENNAVLFLGGSTGLRGFDVGTYSGDTRLIGNLELRSPPLRLWFMQWGAVAFWDIGHAATADPSNFFTAIDALSLKSDVGAGLRMLMPQLQPFVFSFDLAYAVSPPPQAPGAPPPPRFRLVLFIEQAF